MRRVCRSRAVAVALPLAALGCRAELPTYPWVDHRTALAHMAGRGARVGTLGSPARLLLDDGAGRRVRLEAAVAASFPDHLRLRAWKLGRATLDVVVKPGGLWVMAAENGGGIDDALSAGAGGDRLLDALGAAAGGLFEDDRVRILDDGGETFTLLRPLEGGGDTAQVRCVIHRATLTPRLVVVEDVGGAGRYRVALDDYRALDGIAWPTRLEASSSDGRRLVMWLTDPQLNQELPPRAFEPPARAVRRDR